MSSAVSSGTSSCGQWPTPSSSTQSACGSRSRKRAAADGHGSSRSAVPHATRTGQATRSASSTQRASSARSIIAGASQATTPRISWAMSSAGMCSKRSAM
jgi:hypothetical protein